MKLCVATECQPKSRNLIRYAYQLAEFLRAELTIAHVDSTYEFSVQGNKLFTSGIYKSDKSLEQVIKKLSGLYPNLWDNKFDPRITIQHTILHGNQVSPQIIQLTKRLGTDLLIIEFNR